MPWLHAPAVALALFATLRHTVVAELRLSGAQLVAPYLASLAAFVVGASAPLGVKLETQTEIEARASDIRRLAVETTAMPPGNATGITDAERALLGDWVASRG